MPTYNPYAIDYSQGVDIYDNVTGKYYTEEEAREAPQEVRSRLTLKGRKIGAMVMTIEECKEIQE